MKKNLVKLAVITTLLAACSGGEVKSALGLKKRSPDEFMVMSRPALTVPPAFDLPAPGSAAAPSENPTLENAKTTILGTPAMPASAGSAEDLFLKKAGADNASTEIRSRLEEDERALMHSGEEGAEEKGFFGRLFSPIQLDDPEPIVDPEKEKERIRQNMEDGKPANEGEVPVIDPKPESVLDKIF